MAQDLNSAAPSAARLLAPHGRLRAAVNVSNAVWVERTASGALGGLAPTIANELGESFALAVEIVEYPSAGALFKDRDEDRWDIGFLAIDPSRSKELVFTEPVFFIEGSFVSGASAKLAALERGDVEGSRIGVSRGSAIDLFLERRHPGAALIRFPTLDEALAALRRGEVEAAAGPSQPLRRFAAGSDDAWQVGEPFMRIGQACAVPNSRRAALDALAAALERAMSSATLQNAIANALAGAA